MTKDQIIEMMKQQTAEFEAKRQKARQMFENTPAGGWTESDKVS